MTKVQNISNPGRIGLSLEDVTVNFIVDTGTSGLNAAVSIGDVLMLTYDSAITAYDTKYLGKAIAPVVNESIGNVSQNPHKPLVVCLENIPIGTTAANLVQTRGLIQADAILAACTGTIAIGDVLTANTSKQLVAPSAVEQRIFARALSADSGGKVTVQFDGQGLFGSRRTAAS